MRQPSNNVGTAVAHTNGNGHKPVNKGTTASEAQCRAIFAICKSMNLDMGEVLADYNVSDASQLAIKDASRLIDELKTRQGQRQN